MTTRPSDKSIRRLIAEIEAAGGRVTRAKSGHWKVYVGSRLVTSLPSTPSDWRGLLNARANLRRRGIQLRRDTA